MSKRLLSLLVCGLLMASGVKVFADQRVIHAPRDQQGEQLNPLYSGAKYYRTASTSEVLVTSQPSILLGIILFNSGGNGQPAQNVFATIRDTGIGADGSMNVVARFRFDINTGVQSQRLPFPIRLNTGLAVDLSANSTGEEVTVLYLETN
jgi:hypothetical protein